MDGSRRFGVRGIHEAEDLASFLINPVTLVLDAVLGLDREVHLVRFGNIIGRIIASSWASSARLIPSSVQIVQSRARSS